MLYNEEDTFKTIFGGFVTMISRIILIWFLWTALKDVYAQSYEMSRLNNSVNIIKEPGNITLSTQNF